MFFSGVLQRKYHHMKTSLFTNIDFAIDSYNAVIATRFGISKNALDAIWHGGETIPSGLVNPVPPAPPPFIAPASQVPVVIAPVPVVVAPAEIVKCSYIITRGPCKGSACGISVKKRDCRGFCSKHTKKEGSVPRVRKTQVIPEPVQASVCTVLRKWKQSTNLWHEQTGFIFQSSVDRTVIGVVRDNDVFALEAVDINMCIEHKFAYRVKDVEEEDVEVKEDVKEDVEEEVKEEVKEDVEVGSVLATSDNTEDEVDEPLIPQSPYLDIPETPLVSPIANKEAVNNEKDSIHEVERLLGLLSTDEDFDCVEEEY